ncbi:MAG: porin [Desulfuromonadaceae bacterium]|nr:porin [Desulfuromonadaceae bacterium]MDD5107460.1 porin [Desulfuromonadaceae bacterium]
MKKSKTLAALVTMGLAAAVATPAMALENQFSGSFTSFYDLSNYSANGILANDTKTQNYFVQRVSLGYTAKATEDVKLVTKFEMDYNYWGNSSYTSGGGTGGAIGADSVNLETKNLYLDLNATKSLNAKLGMQGNRDAFKGVIFDSDMAGILLSHSCNDKISGSVGFFRLNDAYGNSNLAIANPTIGKNTQDMFMLDGKYSLSKGTKVGAAYYYIGDKGFDAAEPNTTAVVDAKVHTLGLNAETVVGPLSLNGFALAQFGDLNATDDAKGYAFNLGAKMPLAGGTARAEFLYVSGGDNALYVVPGEGGAFYDNEMIMLSRDKNATSIDNALVFDVNNGNEGVIFGSVGYDYDFSPKLYGSVNAGFAMVAKNTTNNNDYLGTEINCEANYKLTSDVTLGARAGYVVLGDYYDASPSVDNPYDIKLLAKFSF